MEPDPAPKGRLPPRSRATTRPQPSKDTTGESSKPRVELGLGTFQSPIAVGHVLMVRTRETKIFS